MRWSDERYVRLYVRDTADWLALSFDAQALFALLLRKVDRAGLLPLGRQGKKAVAVVLGQVAIWDRLEPALEELLRDGCVVVRDDLLTIPNYLEAQESTQSDAQRQRESRARAKELSQGDSVTKRDGVVTKRDENVTAGHEVSQPVTPCLAVPSRTVPYQPKGSCSEARSEPAALPPDAPPLAHLLREHYPDIRDPVAFAVTQAAACPALDLVAETRRAIAWEVANPTRQKHQHGRFLASWFRSSQDRATGPPRATLRPVNPVSAPAERFAVTREVKL